MKTVYYSKTLEHPSIEGLEIIFEALPELESPADHFSEKEDIESVIAKSTCLSNSYWFSAKVTVRLIGFPEVSAHDFLGCCSYETFEEFHQYENADYFRDMVDTATGELVPQLSRLLGSIEHVLTCCEEKAGA
jgi:hypothetical protein